MILGKLAIKPQGEREGLLELPIVEVPSSMAKGTTTSKNALAIPAIGQAAVVYKIASAQTIGHLGEPLRVKGNDVYTITGYVGILVCKF